MPHAQTSATNPNSQRAATLRKVLFPWEVDSGKNRISKKIQSYIVRGEHVAKQFPPHYLIQRVYLFRIRPARFREETMINSMVSSLHQAV